MTPPRSLRSHEEVQLYLDLHGCACGGPDASRDSALRIRDGEWFAGYHCRCADCGAERSVEFAQPAEIPRPGPYEWAAGDAPSQLLDAGEWLAVAEVYAAAVPADATGLTGRERADACADLAGAIGALAEAAKFLPAGAGQVPDTALWTVRGAARWAAEPHRFSRAALDRDRASYHRLLAELSA